MLEVERVTETFAACADGTWRLGSGYLITPNLVLTAAHTVCVVDEPARDVVVRLLGDRRKLAGRVIWFRRDDDVALVQIVDPVWDPPDLLPVRWGRLTGQRGGLRCEAVGFPDVQRGKHDVRDTEHLLATVNPGTRVKASRYDVLVDSGPADRAGLSAWSGMSGSAVFCSDLLIGVVVEDPPGFASRRLVAVPVQEFINDTKFVELVGNCQLESADLDPLFEPAARWSSPPSPAFLLRADSEVIPFRGRSHLLQKLAAWCDEPTAFSAWLVTGPGGQGKTRLAREFAARLRADGWVCGWLAGALREDPPADLWDRLAESTVPVLVIVDYAETKADQLCRIVTLVAARQRPGLRLRLLLLARSSGEWWRQLTHSTPAVERVLTPTPVVGLTALENTVRGRRDAFRSAVKHFASALQGLDTAADTEWTELAATIEPPADLSHPRYGSILTVHMNALVALLQAGPEPVPTMAGDGIADVLLHHEERYWTNTAAARGLRFTHTQTLARAVAVATLFNASTETQAVTLLGKVPGLRGGSEDQLHAVAEWLHDLYPADRRFWGQLQPDRIGEQLVGRVTADRPDLLGALFEQATFKQAVQALQLLCRAAANQPRLAAVIAGLVAENPDSVGKAAIVAAARAELPSPLINAVRPLNHLLAEQPQILEPLVNIASVTPSLFGAWTVEGRETIIAAYRRLLPNDPATYEPKLAWALFNKARHLLDIGNAQAALKTADEAVQRWRDQGEEADKKGLASASDMLATLLDTAGRSEEALEAARESVRQWEQICADSEADHMGYAQALTNLSALLSGLGHRLESLNAAQQAIAVYDAADDDSDPWFAVVATSAAVNQSNRLMELGDVEGALTGYRTVIDIRRNLVESFPNMFDNDLASALHNLGKALVASGRHTEALEPLDECIGIYRRLVTVLPSAYTVTLARALGAKAMALLTSPDNVRAAVEALCESARLAVQAGDRQTADAAHDGIAIVLRTYPSQFASTYGDITLPAVRAVRPWYTTLETPREKTQNQPQRHTEPKGRKRRRRR